MSEYAYVWEFQVSAQHRLEFEKHYGEEGTWVALFRQSPAFLGTILLQDRANPLRYVTIDRWRSKEAYLAFRTECAAQYEALDAVCEGLTVQEISLGHLEQLKP
jgi:quinol monooxygenase YgiN